MWKHAWEFVTFVQDDDGGGDDQDVHALKWRDNNFGHDKSETFQDGEDVKDWQ